MAGTRSSPPASRRDRKTAALAKGVRIQAPSSGRTEQILTPEAVGFLADLHRRFNPTRKALLNRRLERQAQLDAGALPDFLPATRKIRQGDWRVAPPPKDLQDRRVEITGPTDAKMMINALNSGARCYMADFEDANTPAWTNLIEGQANLTDAIDRRLQFANPDGRTYRLGDKLAVLLVRPRGWHLPERHVEVDGEAMSGSLFDFGLFLFHNGKRLVGKGSGPYLYLPKMENHLEARLWNDVFTHTEEALGLPHGTIKATVLIETILAAFEMDEILYELRDHSAGLNAGRWDYLFSLIKKFRNRADFVLPDRAQLTMTIPFMRAYTELLVRTCHRRGAHAMGGMAAFVPSRKDPKVNETALAKVREDKLRESRDGFDGTWVAHPDLVATATEVFDAALGKRPNQVEKLRKDVRVEARDLLSLRIPGGIATEAGLRSNVRVGLQYLEAWLRGSGAVAIDNLMEDAATSEICRSQVWQWVRHGVKLQNGQVVTRDLVRKILDEESARLRTGLGPGYERGRFGDARAVFERVALSPDFVEFLTLPAYERID